MSEGILTKDDIRAYTGRARLEDQERVLSDDGVPFKRRGRDLVVLWTHVRASIEGRPIAVSRGINLDAVK